MLRTSSKYDHRPSGLLLPVTLAHHIAFPSSGRLDLGNAPGRANTGDKVMTLVAGWLAATALTTPMRCAPEGRPAPWAARSRRHPPWEPSCAASVGATFANWTG